MPGDGLSIHVAALPTDHSTETTREAKPLTYHFTRLYSSLVLTQMSPCVITNIYLVKESVFSCASIFTQILLLFPCINSKYDLLNI